VVARIAGVSVADGTIILDSVTSGSGGGGGGFFSDGVGTNAAIGKGATLPTASGENSLAQGNGSDAGGTNSVSIGLSNNASGDASFAAGDGNNTEQNQTFMQGSGNEATGDGYNNFLQGRDNTMYYGYNSFIQGYYNYLEGNTGSYNYQTFMQGSYNTISYADNTFAQGYSNDINTGAYNSFAQGQGNTIDAAYSLSQGRGNTISSAYSFAQGYSNSIGTPYSFAQGRGNTITSGGSGRVNVVMGYNNTTSADAYRAFASGENHTVGAVSNSTTFGYYNTLAGDNSLAVGYRCEANDYNTVAIGKGTTTHSLNNFAFGSYCRAGYGDYPGNVAMGGYYCYADGYNSQAFGYYSQIDVGAGYSTILGGFTTTIEAQNCMAHGKTAGADITGQRAFSAQISSGSSDVGPYPKGPANAQWSFIAHEVGFGASVDIDIPTDTGRAYSFQINMVVNHVAGTPTDRGSFVVSQMLVHNTAGTATLVGSPVFTAITDGSDIANVTTAITTSGANVRFTFTRNAGVLPYRIAYYISFIERA
jgi:trimeric autotransporter adhesin